MRAVGGLASLLLVAAAIIGAFALATTPGAAGVEPETVNGSGGRALPPAGGEEQVTGQELAEDGRQLFLMSCASCHGAAGEGSQFAPSLVNVGAAANDFYMRTGRMPPGGLGTPPWNQEPHLSERQIEAIVAYASGFGEGPAIPEVVADVGSLQRGWQLYINNCAACHGATGGGGGIGGGVVAPGLGRSDPLIVAEAMIVGPGAMPRFTFAQDDVNAIAAYVQHLRSEPAPGGIPLAGAGPVPEGFIAGLVGVGLLILIVRWIARRAEFEPAADETER